MTERKQIVLLIVGIILFWFFASDSLVYWTIAEKRLVLLPGQYCVFLDQP